MASGIKEAKYDEKKKELTIVMECESKPKPSKSGKSLIVATTSGNKAQNIQVNGKDLVVSVNAYISNDDYEDEE